MQLRLLVALAVVIALRIHERKRKADATENYPEELETEEVDEAKEEPDEWVAVESRPEHEGVRLTHALLAIVALVMKDLLPAVINLGPPSEIDEEASSNILHGPKVEGGESHDEDERGNLVAQNCIQEHETEYGKALEHQMENADGGVVCCGKEAGVGVDGLLLLGLIKHLVAHSLRHGQALWRLIRVLIRVSASCEDAGEATEEGRLLLRPLIAKAGRRRPLSLPLIHGNT